MYREALDELRTRWRDGNHYIGREDIERWSLASGLNASQLFDTLAIELAVDFYIGFLGWAFADGVANSLWGTLLEMSQEVPEWPEAFNEFYLAFDDSERADRPRDRELIRSFLGKHRHLTG